MKSLSTPHGTLIFDELGGVIRGCRLSGVWVMPDTREHAPEYAAGEQLFPWPNRLRNGQWIDDGEIRRNPINEPSRSNAIHGLLRGVRFIPTIEDSALRLRGRLEPSDGYPFRISCTVTFAFSAGELSVTSLFVNDSSRPAPWAFGSHPYLSLPGTSADVQFTLPSTSYLETDERLIPTESRSVVGTALDFRSARSVADMRVDHAFERADGDSDTLATLTSADHTLSLWADPQFGYVQIFVPPFESSLHRSGPAVAVEPMTAPADALNSGNGLRWLQPGERIELRWGIRLRSN